MIDTRFTSIIFRRLLSPEIVYFRSLAILGAHRTELRTITINSDPTVHCMNLRDDVYTKLRSLLPAFNMNFDACVLFGMGDIPTTLRIPGSERLTQKRLTLSGFVEKDAQWRYVSLREIHPAFKDARDMPVLPGFPATPYHILDAGAAVQRKQFFRSSGAESSAMDHVREAPNQFYRTLFDRDPVPVSITADKIFSIGNAEMLGANNDFWY